MLVEENEINATYYDRKGYAYKLVKIEEEDKAMAKLEKYKWCEPTGTTNKEFLGWIYDRLQKVFGEPFDLSYMKRLDTIIEKSEGSIPNGPKMIVDHVEKGPVIIKRNGKIVYED